MKVCYWTPNAGGGAGKYEHYLPREIQKLGVFVEVFRRPRGIKGNPLTLKYFYKNDGDIVHATSQTLSIYSYPKPKNFIVTVHDIYTLHRALSSKIKRMLIKKALKRADRIIAVSNFTKEELLGININEEKIEVVPMGIDLNLYKPMNKEFCKKYFRLNLDNKYILVVASNAPHKRMDIVKRVFEKIKCCREDVKLIKAGYGQTLRGEGVINTGYLPEKDMPLLYNAADVLLHPSEYEGFGMPLLEAMACGLPIVASNKASIPEVVGKCAYLVDLHEDCIDDFAEMVLKALEKRRNVAGIERAKSFSWTNIAKMTLKIYEECL